MRRLMLIIIKSIALFIFYFWSQTHHAQLRHLSWMLQLNVLVQGAFWPVLLVAGHALVVTLNLRCISPKTLCVLRSVRRRLRCHLHPDILLQVLLKLERWWELLNRRLVLFQGWNRDWSLRIIIFYFLFLMLVRTRWSFTFWCLMDWAWLFDATWFVLGKINLFKHTLQVVLICILLFKKLHVVR